MQFLTKKKLFGSHVDCCYLTIYLCPTLDCYKHLMHSAKQKSKLKLLDSFPASQVLHLHHTDNEVYSSVVLNLRGGRADEAEMIMLNFALKA